MGTEINPAWISAAAALLGTIVGGLLAVGKDIFLERRKLAREKTYLAVIVSSRLNEFASQCAVVAEDDGTDHGRPASKNGMEHEPTTKAPELKPLEIKVNWEILPNDLLDSIFRLPDQRQMIERHLEYVAEYELDPPEHFEYFFHRRRGYAELAIHASYLAKKLRQQAKLPTDHFSEGNVDLAQEMRRVILEMDNAQEQYMRKKRGIKQVLQQL